MKQYQAVFFDWDGTAVESRNAPVDEVVCAMQPLLAKGVKLVIISGTTYEKIAGGQLHTYFSQPELTNLFLGLGRGAYDYRFDASGQLQQFGPGDLPLLQTLALHAACFALHQTLLKQYGLQTDLVFSRPNYCKVDLMSTHDRGDKLFFQQDELTAVEALLGGHGIAGGLAQVLNLAVQLAQDEGIAVQATTDAKYVEIGSTTKSDNTDCMLHMLHTEYGVTAEDCCFWGDEFCSMGDCVHGSDSFMITERSQKADFFDVSVHEGNRPAPVRHMGGGVQTFLDFLREGAAMRL